jgi:hypothetical protein
MTWDFIKGRLSEANAWHIPTIAISSLRVSFFLAFGILLNIALKRYG